jgi:hypothetical protein
MVIWVRVVWGCSLRLLQDKSTKEPKKLSLAEQTIVCIDSVNGDGSTVIEMGKLLKAWIITLPFMSQSILKKWAQLLENREAPLPSTDAGRQGTGCSGPS